MNDTNEKDEPTIKVEDRRFWARGETDEPETPPAANPELEAALARAEAAEKRLYDLSAAVTQMRQEQEAMRQRVERDLDRRVAGKFGDVVEGVLQALDDLDLAIEHAKGNPAAEAFAHGAAIARDRFVAALQRGGVERMDLDGTEFDPNVAEALAAEPVEDPSKHHTVLRTMRPGYRLGDRVLRAARVIVGRA
ncbi:MAG TPA: nucleotide exchange factor GrpE [Candidatus Polarisedimenticolaceae bacterium]